MKRSLILLAMLAACRHKGGDARPTYDDSLLAPDAKGLKVGLATLDDVTKAFPAAEVNKDKSLGGTDIVEYNGDKAIHINGQAVNAHVVNGKLVHLIVHGPGLYDWLVGKMDGMAGSKDCPGNRKMGKSGGEAAYCASAGDKVVFIEAHKGGDEDELDYHVVK